MKIGPLGELEYRDGEMKKTKMEKKEWSTLRFGWSMEHNCRVKMYVVGCGV